MEAEISTLIQQVRAQRGGNYTLQAGDLLSITLYREPDLDRILRVGKDGAISLPLIGTAKVAGMTVAEAEATISRRFRDFLVSPQVTVFVKEYGNRRFFVLGEVAKPGSYDLPSETRLTVLEAVSMAGGFTAIAARDRTRIIRSRPDGKSEDITVEVSAITHRGDKNKDIPLVPNDVVYIPQSFF